MTRELVQYLRYVTTPGYHPGWGADEYTDWRDEQLSWKTGCYVGDWSFLWDVELSGPDALKLLSDTSVNSFESFAIGQAKHIVQCNSWGKVIAEGIAMRLGEDRFALQSSPALYTTYVLNKGGYDAQWTHRDTFQLQVSGPTALPLLQKLSGDPLTDVKFMHFKPVTIAGVEVLALRQGMAGEIGFELHGPHDSKDAIIAALMESGQEFGIRRLGKRTAMINHLEGAFPTGLWHYLKDLFGPDVEGYGEWAATQFDLYGLDPHIVGSLDGELNDYLQSPYALGWGKQVKFDHEFIGRAALEQEAAAPPTTRVTLEWNSEDVVDIYASLFRDDEQPYDYLEIPHPQRWVVWADQVDGPNGSRGGVSSTPGYSLYFRKVLSLAFIDSALAEPGTEVTILWGNPGTPQKKVRATVRPAPYKTDNRRADLALAGPATA